MAWKGGGGWKGAPDGYDAWGPPAKGSKGWYADQGYGQAKGSPYGKAGAKGKGSPYGKGQASWSAPAAVPMDEKSDLVDQVKTLQRSDPGAKNMWERYADATRTGTRDPARHTEDSLWNFLDAYQSGADVEQRAAQGAGSTVVRLRGVPFQCGVADVIEFLADFGVDETQVVLGRKPDGKVTGEAFVAFVSDQEAERAVQVKHHQEIQGRYIEMFRSCDADFNEAVEIAARGIGSTGDDAKDQLVRMVKQIQRSGEDAKLLWYRFCEATKTGNRDPSRHTSAALQGFIEAYENGIEPEAAAVARASAVLRLRGVPFQAEVQDVVEFMVDYGVAAPQVTIARDSKGRKSGEAFADLGTVDSAEQAMEERQNKEIYGRYIELFRSSDEERQQNIKQASAAMMSIDAQREAIVPFNGAGARAASSGGVQAQSSTDAEKDRLVAKLKQIQKSGYDGKAKWERYCDIARTGNRDPVLHTAESLTLFIDAFLRGEEPEVPAAAHAGISPVLRLRGVPFQSDILDVVEFLSDYSVDKDGVALGRGPDGRVTGEAYVVFPSVELAERALDEKQRHEINKRYIELFRSSTEEFEHMKSIAPGGFESTGNRDKDDLVARVKQIQRGREDGRTKWEEYCTEMRTGNRDPLRHTVESLRNFVESYDRGEKPNVSIGGNVLRLRGVPFQAELATVVDFLREYQVETHECHIGSKDGRKTGEAFVKFKNETLALHALNNLQRCEMLGRYIELFRSSEEELWEFCPPLEERSETSGLSEKDDLVSQVKAVQKASDEGRHYWESYCDMLGTGNRDPQRHTPATMRAFLEAMQTGESVEQLVARTATRSTVLRLRGVPFQCVAEDVVAFFSGYGLRASQVTIGRPEGRGAGMVFVEFRTADDAERALQSMQRQEIQGRYIELFRSSYEEREDCGKAAAAREASAIVPFGLNARGKGGRASSQLPPNAPTLRLRGLPFQCSVKAVAEFLAEYFVDESQIAISVGEDGKCTGEGFVACSTPELASFIMKEKHMATLGKRYIEISEASFEEFRQLSGVRSMPSRQFPATKSSGKAAAGKGAYGGGKGAYGGKDAWGAEGMWGAEGWDGPYGAYAKGGYDGGKGGYDGYDAPYGKGYAPKGKGLGYGKAKGGKEGGWDAWDAWDEGAAGYAAGYAQGKGGFGKGKEAGYLAGLEAARNEAAKAAGKGGGYGGW